MGKTSKTRLHSLDSIKKGDHIIVDEGIFEKDSHYIARGEVQGGRLPVYKCHLFQKRTIMRVQVEKTEISMPEQKLYLREYRREDKYRKETVLERAESCVGKPDLPGQYVYAVFADSEQFAIWCKTGPPLPEPGTAVKNNSFECIKKKVKTRSLKKGDHVTARMESLALLKHHSIVCAIDDGNVQGYEYTTRDDCRGETGIIQMFKIAQGECCLVEYRPKTMAYLNSPEKSVRMAESCWGKEGFGGVEQYNARTNNCEHFAAWCKTGIPTSEQVDKITIGVLAGVLTTPAAVGALVGFGLSFAIPIPVVTQIVGTAVGAGIGGAIGAITTAGLAYNSVSEREERIAEAEEDREYTSRE